MADTKVSALDAAETLTGEEILYLIQAVADKKVTLDQINAFFRAGLITVDGVEATYPLEITEDVTAAGVPFTPAGGIAATDVQAAIEAVAQALPYSLLVSSLRPPTDSSSAPIYTYAAAFNTATIAVSTAQGCWIEWTVEVAAGTYALAALHPLGTNQGILSVSIDGAAALGTTIDTYGAFAANQRAEISAIALAAGRHTVRFTTATKNASSSNYALVMYGFSLVRTGA